MRREHSMRRAVAVLLLVLAVGTGSAASAPASGDPAAGLPDTPTRVQVFPGPGALLIILNPSSVTLEGGVLTVKASGVELWDQQDEGTVVGKAIAGDYSISVRVLAKPTGGHPLSAKGGVIIREGLVPGDRYAFAMVMSGRGVYFEGRRGFWGGDLGDFAQPGTDDAHTTPPVWVKLVKTGGKIAAFQSSDGTDYVPVGDVQDFGPMAPVTYAGLGAAAVNQNVPAYQYVTDRFDAASLRIEPLGV